MTTNNGLPAFSNATTKITISKGDLQSAIQMWLNQRILKVPVSVVTVTTVGTQYNTEVECATFELDLLEVDKEESNGEDNVT